jgi:hypothetical protein
MNNKTIIILAAVIGIGAYFYFNNKKQPVSNGANTGGGGTSPGGPGPVGPVTVTDTGDDGTETGTGTTDDTGTDTTDGGTTVYPGAPTPNTPTNQEIDTMITACVSVGGTWTTGGCIYSNSPNPRGSQTGSGTTSGIGPRGINFGTLDELDEIITNPKTGYTTNTNTGFDTETGGTNTYGTNTNYALEFAGLKNKIFA